MQIEIEKNNALGFNLLPYIADIGMIGTQGKLHVQLGIVTSAISLLNNYNNLILPIYI